MLGVKVQLLLRADSAFTMIILITFSILISVINAERNNPHIIVILADDMGWNDVSFHGSDQIPTPNIDALAYNGVILNSHYTPALCTPSRAALMTGKYPIHTGMQHLVILEAEPWGLPLYERLMPQYLKQKGYSTHAIGKWHLGFYRKEYTPTYRGFDTHLGYYQGFQDYYDHSVKATFSPYDGYDMRRNHTVDWSAKGKYSTDLFTDEAVNIIKSHNNRNPMFLYVAHLAPHTGNRRDPFQAPDEDIARFRHIQDPERRVYAAMVSKLDESVGEIVSALRENGMLDNSIILFMSDNGAPTFGIHSNRGSNYPLRGIKETPWEGAVRSVAAVWSPLIKKTQRVSNQLMHMVDWLPTLYSMAGGDISDLGDIDGMNMWSMLSEDEQSPRTELVHNIDDVGDVYAALRQGDWKYIKGQVHKGVADKWYGESGRTDDISYDIKSVLNSRVGITLAGFITRQQIHEKLSKQTDGHSFNLVSQPESSQWKLLQEETVLHLRQQAEITCLETNQTRTNIECRPNIAPCLFNIRDDPCEQVNFAEDQPLVLQSLEESLLRYRATVVKPRNIPEDPEADPALWNHTWVSWHDELDTLAFIEITSQGEDEPTEFATLVIMAAGLALGLLIIIVFLVRHLTPSNKIAAAVGESVNVINVFRMNGSSTKKKINNDEADSSE
ncbi:arylsulfatase B-like [Lycorma delicatula]|uniref:arylsulfatase B-like n=1 Tax=Lycorma delicatula TaxID=130591 RepID=UPI003F50E092